MGLSTDQDNEVNEFFAEFEKLTIPNLEVVPLVKIRTVEQLQKDTERYRKRQTEDRERRYKSNVTEKMNFVTDDQFMARGNVVVPDPVIISIVNITQEDLESYEQGMKPIEPIIEDNSHFSAYDRLYTQRERIGWTMAEWAAFKKANKILERGMDIRNIARIPNAPKRIGKAEKVNLQLRRYNADEVRERVKNDEVDIFGYFNLVPLTLAKTSETAVERKRKVMYRYADLICDYDYANRPYQREREEKYAEMVEMRKRMKVMEARIAELKKSKRERLLKKGEQTAEQDPIKPVKVIRKRKKREWEEHFEESVNGWISCCDEFVNHERGIIDEDTQKATLVKSEADAKKKEEAEAKKRALEAKKQALEAKKRRDAELKMERKKKKEEEWKKKQELIRLKKEEDQRKKDAEKKEAELKLQQEKEKEELAKQEELRKEALLQQERNRVEELRQKQFQEEEQKRIKEAEVERRRLAAEREKQRKLEEEEELRRMQRRMEATRMEIQKQNTPPEAPLLQKNWTLLKVGFPKRFSEVKEKYRSHFDIPEPADQRRLELVEMMDNCSKKGRYTVIPMVNSPKTMVTQLVVPKPKPATKPKIVEPPKTVAVNPRNQPANDHDLKACLERLASMLKKRKHLSICLNTREEEIDYQLVNLHDLKTSLLYPFRDADGMYWPVFFGLPPTTLSSTNLEHAKACAKCNSYSGKYASYLLLTTTPTEDENQERKFEDNFGDSDGDWVDYSRKPGRFANRIGYKAKDGSPEDFFVQKERAVKKYNEDFRQEVEEFDEFERHRREFDQHGDKARYAQHLKTHLRELVRDARLDVYSIKETFDGYGNIDHPGTRESPISVAWHSHGYNKYVRTRDEFFALYMNDVCREYERLLPLPNDDREEFEDWCLTPMLASLYYQASYDTFYVFPKEEMSILEERRKKYLALLSSKRFDLNEMERVCALTKTDKKQWTFLLDQLVSHFREFPSTFQMMYNTKLELHSCVQNAINDVMSSCQRDNSNSWVDQI